MRTQNRTSDTKTAIGYVRVSTEEQATSGVSLAAQAAKVRAYCALYDLDLVELIEDAGASAKTSIARGCNALSPPSAAAPPLASWSPSSTA